MRDGSRCSCIVYFRVRQSLFPHQNPPFLILLLACSFRSRIKQLALVQPFSMNFAFSEGTEKKTETLRPELAVVQPFHIWLARSAVGANQVDFTFPIARETCTGINKQTKSNGPATWGH